MTVVAVVSARSAARESAQMTRAAVGASAPLTRAAVTSPLRRARSESPGTAIARSVAAPGSELRARGRQRPSQQRWHRQWRQGEVAVAVAAATTADRNARDALVERSRLASRAPAAWCRPRAAAAAGSIAAAAAADTTPRCPPSRRLSCCTARPRGRFSIRRGRRVGRASATAHPSAASRRLAWPSRTTRAPAPAGTGRAALTARKLA